VTPRFLFVVSVGVVGVFRFLFESVVMGTQFVVEPPPVPPEVEHIRRHPDCHFRMKGSLVQA
jgi:hypothetical protein